MSNATLVPANNVSRSKQSIKRSIEGHTVEVVMPTGVTITSVFSSIASALKGVINPRRPNRCRPIHQDLCGFASEAEKNQWDAASDEAWEAIDAE